MNAYRERVIYYFESEYSNLSISQIIDRIHVYEDRELKRRDPKPTTIGELRNSDEQAKYRAKWCQKVEQIVRAFYEADKPPADAAHKLASILNAYARQQLLGGVIDRSED